jgi:hypothetical protein
MLKTWFVPLTEGAVYPSMLTWNGSRRNAPDTPPMEVKNENANATKNGMNGLTSTPETGKSMIFASLFRGCPMAVIFGNYGLYFSLTDKMFLSI